MRQIQLGEQGARIEDVQFDFASLLRDGLNAPFRLVALLFTLGIATRITGVLTWVAVVSFLGNPAASYDADFLINILAFYLMLGYLLLGFWNGRLSIFEPINSFPVRRGADDLFGLDLDPVADLVAKVRAQYAPTGPDPDDPMIDFDERDLLRWAAQAGFTRLSLDYRAQVDAPGPPVTDWEALKRTAPHRHDPETDFGVLMAFLLPTNAILRPAA